jgi:NAD(P)-dependent dehydrogenase (short-subunit alcohol dehydrogenase family)
MAATVVGRWGQIDGLMNNAAMFQRPQITDGPIEEIPVEEWDRVMAVNLKGPFLCCRAVIGQMKEQMYGKIVNISSGTVFSGRSILHYVSSKGGVTAFTRVLAKQTGDWHITVNSIAPGLTASDPERDQSTYEGRVSARSIPRVQEPDDLVGAGVFLLSSESDFMSGQTMVVDGGAVMH